MVRIQRVLHNAAVIEANDREQRLQLQSSTAPDSAPDEIGSKQEVPLGQGLGSPLTKRAGKEDSPEQPSVRDMHSRNDDTPESWSPRVVRRGGSL